MRKKILLCLSFFIGLSSHAQIYQDKKSQHRFAQTYVGIDAVWQPEQGTFNHLGSTESFSSKFTPCFSLGGIHFWGKLDFFMSFRIPLEQTQPLSDEYEMNQAYFGEFSARYYPWRIKANALRPFLGFGSQISSIQLIDPSNMQRADSYFHPSIIAGASTYYHDWQLNVEATYLFNTNQTFYSSATEAHTFEIPHVYFKLGLRRYFDVTLKEEKDKENGRTERIRKKLEQENKLSSFSISAGPSSAFFIQAPQYDKMGLASLPRQKAAFNWDLGLGYFFNQRKIHIGLTFREFKSDIESFEYEEVIRRRSIALEGYKFIWDYNGFVPFIGGTVSMESWATALFVHDEPLETFRTQFFSPGIIFGWDIIPTPLDTWTLRTNLRYYPFQKIKTIDGTVQRVDQFEFNFIQVVIYPNRMINVRKVRKNNPPENRH